MPRAATARAVARFGRSGATAAENINGRGSMAQQGFNRRQALGIGAGAAAVAGAALVPGTAGAQEPNPVRRHPAEDLVPRQNIGIQLFTIRDMQAASVADTINLIGGIGIPE